ncbi:MAG: orotidine-5'-phosphate decarboxylase [Pseudomonadota bacterium]|nr:orotidine-5'-phosphate decarboxylase [Gammaproteobacteria bacterium]MDQ3581896.1 orotidine-5'-phosphate decarboxylase [Pseudomonadota bacterium]
MTKNIPIAERLIFALDVDTKDQAAEWLARLGERVHFYKVGLQLFLGGWFPVIDLIRNQGHKVMVDLKFFDIPETVELAVRQLKDRGVEFITVHGNEEILKAANRTKNGSKILAVTLLTSFDEADLRDMGLTCDIQTFVLYRAQKALRLGCDGVISSGMEAAALRRELGDQFLIVTPGIRPGANTETNDDDQKRIASAYEAIRNGADHVVVGRPIRNAPDPVAMVEAMHAEITRALLEN